MRSSQPVTLRNSLIGLIVFANCLQFALLPSGTVFSDSVAYGAGNDRNWDLISLTGDALRNWPIVLLNVLLGDRVLQTIVQFLVSIISWSFLIWNLQRAVPRRVFYFSAFLISILAISPYILSWNSVLLGESYGISFFVLSLSLGLRSRASHKERDYFLFFLSLFFWASLQSRHFLALVTLILFSIPFMITKFTLGDLKKHKSKFVSLLLILGYLGILSTNQQNQDFKRDISYRAFSNIYTFAAHSQSDIIKSALVEQPGFKCLNLFDETDVLQIVEKLTADCPEALNWLEQNFAQWYVKFLLSNPTYLAKLFMEGLASSNNPPEFYSGTISMVPNVFTSIFFGSRNYSFGSFENVSNKMVLVENDKQSFVVIQKGNNQSYNAVKANAPIFIWIYFVLVVWFQKALHLFRKRKVISEIKLDPVFVMLNLSVLGFCMNLVACPAEYFKLTIQFSVGLFIGIILMLGSKLEVKEAYDEAHQS